MIMDSENQIDSIPVIQMRPRYVCTCNLVTEADLVLSIHAGNKTLEEIQDKTKASTKCGSCLKTVMRILERELKKN